MPTKSRTANVLIVTISLALFSLLGISCTSNTAASGPNSYGNQIGNTQAEADSATTPDSATVDRERASRRSNDHAQPTGDRGKDAAKALPNDPVDRPGRTVADTAAERAGSADKLAHHHHNYNREIDNEDSASAVDDQIWRLFDLAQEYHAMGVLANREASWEEAQYYFEKSLKILASLDIEADSVLTPEASKYNSLLENLISDYRVTLRSLGELQGDVAPSVIIERFGELGLQLGNDSMRVFKDEVRPITYDLPVKMNDRVKKSIIYYQTVAKDFIYKTLTRMPRYEKLFRRKLREHGLPQDLVYLSLVESGFNPKAYSWARASGLWQFISSTGKTYGLHRNWWMDERRDPEKSTDAACRFLKDLYKQFGDWELAMAAYNGGPGRVSRTIKKQKTTDFWRMKLKRQTMDYVPLIYAAAIIAKDPERYGFDVSSITPESEIVWDEVTTRKCLDLKVVAREVGCSVADLKALNPELLRNYTPPNVKSYTLKIPVGHQAKFLAAYEGMPSPKETSWVKHKIRRGETVSTIAAKYGVSQYAIFEANNLKRRSRIYAGKTIIVPVPLDRGSSGSRGRKNRNYNADNSVYTVRSGDTMWDIARAFGTTVSGLRRINYIERGSRIYVGQKLKIPSNATKLKKQTTSKKTYASSGSKSTKSATTKKASSKTYKVRSGDSLWDIARRYGTTTARLRSLNSLGRSSRIYPGQMLTVSGTGSGDYVIHKVRRGETISRIAKRYSTTVGRILTANNRSDPDNIYVGEKLKIYTR